MSNTKEKWKKESGYIWSMIGSAVGFANILSFSALCYKNGGGAFLIPYLIAHLIVGIPMLFLEGSIGQRMKLPLISAMGNVLGGKGRILGWFSVLTCATIGGFYMVLTGFAVAYSYFTASGAIPADTAYFFKELFLQDTGDVMKIGSLAKGVLYSTLLVAFFTWLVMARKIQSGIEKICTLFLPILAVMIFALFIMTFFLPGASVGYTHYLVPDFSKLTNWTLWRDVFGQVFFSLSLGLGIIVGYSRHNPDNFSIPRAMVKVAIGDVLISIIAGFAIFGCIGFMSVKSGVPFSEIVTSDSAFEIGFVIFPKILSQFGPVIGSILGPLFFICIFIAGITGVFSIVESVAGNIEIEFNKSRKSAVGRAMLFITLLSLPFCMGNGQPLLGAICPMVLGNAMLVGGIGELLIFLFISKVVSSDPIWKGSYAFYSLKYFVLPVLVISLLGALYTELKAPFGMSEVIRYGWFVAVLLSSYYLSSRSSVVSLQRKRVA